MIFESEYTYHIYNRSNEKVFYNHENYLFFLRKTNKLIKPFCDILAWCLMPNHFHFLINVNSKSVEMTNEKHRPDTQILSKQFGTLLSSYTQAINRQEKRKGSLWAHRTEAKCINYGSNNYIDTCFFYIHQNPINDKLVTQLEDWEFSSFLEYCKIRNGELTNMKLAKQI